MMDIPLHTKAAILREIGKPLDIQTIRLPEILEAGQVLVKIHYSGICGSQLGEIDGVKGKDEFLPHLLGHEASGTVISIGPGVRYVNPNDRVILHWRKGSGIDASPASYSLNNTKINAGPIATFSEYAVVSENRLSVIQQSINVKASALFGCAVTTGFGVVLNNAQLKIGESCVVFGAGGVGLHIIQAAKMVSADPIIAVDRYAARLELAEKMGATHFINSEEEDAESAIQKIVGKNQLDCFIDNTGNPKIIEMGYQITHPQGRVILVGVPKHDQRVSIYTLPLHFKKIFSGSHGGEANPHIDIPRYLRLYQQNKIQIDELITDVFPLDKINDAIHALRNGKVIGRCLIEMEN